ncbi:MAG: N-acetylmuramoyl-L-alanine amidase [Mariniphaga sp.]
MCLPRIFRIPVHSDAFRVMLLFIFSFIFSNLFAQKDSICIKKQEVVLNGISRGQLPYLKYGPGTDRLGGAKMTYLDTAIVMQVIDSLKDDYIVRLSANHKAFIPKENVRFIKDYRKPNYDFTSSWKVFGDEKFDYVNIYLDERLPYKSVQMINPAKIVVDIFGATGNTNWITQLKSAMEVKNVYHEQTEDDVFRVTIELKHKQHWGYSIYYKNKTLVIKVKQQPKQLDLQHLKIAVDAGHGGSNTGATGLKTNVNEKDCNLEIAKKLQKCLKQRGAEVFMTRNGDEELTMVDRTLMLRSESPDLLISIHNNASDNPNVSGTSTYYRYIGFKPLTVTVLNRLLELGLKEFGDIGSFNFALNGPTEYPNCLVEVAFLSNVEDEKKIIDPHFQKLVAKKIRKGIVDWIRKAK